MLFNDYIDMFKFTVIPAFGLPFLLLGIYRLIAATKKPILADIRCYLYFCLFLVLVCSAIERAANEWMGMNYGESVFLLFSGLLPYGIIGFFQLKKKIRPVGIVISLIVEFLSFPIWLFMLFLFDMCIDPPD